MKKGLIITSYIEHQHALDVSGVDYDLVICADGGLVRAKELGLSLPVDEYDTFGGYIFGVLGSVPDDGSKFELDSDGLHIRVLRVSGHRVEGSIVTKQPEEKEE